MRVSVHFNGQGLELILRAESVQEKAMVGAVINQPFTDPAYRPHEVESSLVFATVHYDGHWTNKSVESLSLRVHRQESDGTT